MSQRAIVVQDYIYALGVPGFQQSAGKYLLAHWKT